MLFLIPPPILVSSMLVGQIGFIRFLNLKCCPSFVEAYIRNISGQYMKHRCAILLINILYINN